MVRVFDGGNSNSGSDAFRQWMVTNPDGYFVNLKGPTVGRLHRGDCPHMKFGDEDRINFVANHKWVGENPEELRAHAAPERIQLEACDTPKCNR